MTAGIRLSAALLGLVVIACGGSSESTEQGTPARSGSAADTFIGSLAADPRDGTLFLGTGRGLFRLDPGRKKARRVVGELRTPAGSGPVSSSMVVRFAGPGELLASGHPEGAGSALPENLGLVRSTDGGVTWEPVSGLGDADFHILQAAGEHVLAVRAEEEKVALSSDGGRTFDAGTAPDVPVGLFVKQTWETKRQKRSDFCRLHGRSFPKGTGPAPGRTSGPHCQRGLFTESRKNVDFVHSFVQSCNRMHHMAFDSTANGATAGVGAMLQAIRATESITRAELAASTGLARSTVAQRIGALLAHGLVVPVGENASTGGRPPQAFAFNTQAGVILAADLGATHCRIAVTDLGARVIAEESHDVAIALGPDAVLGWLEEALGALLKSVGRAPADVRGVGVGVPGPVEFASGTPVAPPIMPGWDGYPVAGRLGRHFDAPTLVDNDVNIMALGEHWTACRDCDHMLFVKVGTGIGCGIVTQGRIHRGALGAAGDIGHIHVPKHDDVLCRCGNQGCLEAVAGGAALAATLSAEGIDAANTRDVVALVRQGRPRAMQLVRQAGRELGEVLAAAVNFFNPSVIVIGGDMAHANEPLLAGVRQLVYQRAVPLGTRSLRITRSTLDDRSGVVGAAVMLIEHIFSPEAVDARLAEAA